MVDVGVGDDDLLHLQLVFADDGKNVFDVVARIDDHGFVRRLVADDRAVTLQRTDGKYLVDHAFIFAQEATINHLSGREKSKLPGKAFLLGFLQVQGLLFDSAGKRRQSAAAGAVDRLAAAAVDRAAAEATAALGSYTAETAGGASNCASDFTSSG